MRLLPYGVTDTSRGASPTRRSERPKPARNARKTIPKPLYRQTYQASRRVAAAYCITKIPSHHGACARGAFIQNFKRIAPSTFGTKHNVEEVNEQGTITQVATLQSVPLPQYPPASTMLDAEFNAQGTSEQTITAGVSHTDRCSVATTEAKLGHSAVMSHSGSGLEQLRRSLARIKSAMADEPLPMQQSSSSGGEDTFEEVRLKLAKHRTAVAGSMRSLWQALQNQFPGVCSR